MFENHRKCLIQNCERSELVDKSSLKIPKMLNLAIFWKREACGQTVLPDRSVLIGQKSMENAKIKKFKWDILDDFQTMCEGSYLIVFDLGLSSSSLKKKMKIVTGSIKSKFHSAFQKWKIDLSHEIDKNCVRPRKAYSCQSD